MRQLTLFTLLCLAAGSIFADEPVHVETHHVEVLTIGDGDADVFRLDGEDLEIGESREFTTKDGQEVSIIRHDDGYQITIDGESVLEPGAFNFTFDGEGQVIKHMEKIKHLDLGDGAHGHKMIMVGTDSVHVEGGEGHEKLWIETGSSPQVFRFGADHGALEHLRESGALDGLDAESRERIEKSLEDYDTKKSAHRVIKMRLADPSGDDGSSLH